MQYFASLGFMPALAMNPAEVLLDLATGQVNDISTPEDLRGSPNPEEFERTVIKVITNSSLSVTLYMYFQRKHL